MHILSVQQLTFYLSQKQISDCREFPRKGGKCRYHPISVSCLSDSLMGLLSLVPGAEWQKGTCTTGFGSPGQAQDSKVPVLSGMETRHAAKLLTQQEHGASPWQRLSSPRGAEHSPPSSDPALGDTQHHGGLRSTPVVLHFRGWSVQPHPSFSHRAQGHS